MDKPWEIVDLRHQKNGKIKIVSGCTDIANVLTRDVDDPMRNAQIIVGAAALLARHTALVEGVKKERSLLKLIGSCRNSPKEGVSPSAAVADLASARAEVDRLLLEEKP